MVPFHKVSHFITIVIILKFVLNILKFSSNNWFGLMKFCDEVNIQLVPSIDISNDVGELEDVLDQIKEYLDLFNGFK